MKTKVEVYRAVVRTTLLFGSDCWTLYRRHIKQLEQFHMRCLRKIAGIRWHDRVSNTRVLEMCGIGQLASGCRLQGGPVRRYKDSLKINLRACDLAPSVLRTAPLDGLHPLTGVSGDTAAQKPYRLSRRGAQQLLSPSGRPGGTLLLQEGR